MSDSYNVPPPIPEQDQSGGDGLPTYDDLAAQHGPNSRFGRWREWIEKRAAERYADATPADRERRRHRGWGLDPEPAPQQEPPSNSTYSVYAPSTYPLANVSTYASSTYPVSMYSTSTAPSSITFVQPPPLHPQLHLQTSFTQPMPSPLTHTNYPPPTPTLIPESLDPSRLKLYHFGSRFLPHTTYPIRCLLPLSNHHLLLIGHDNGLSVLDMFPNEWDEDNEDDKGPSDAVAKAIWEGEGVYQMTILESESTGEGTPQGIVLALVTPQGDPSKEGDCPRALRMYNLASLVSLAKWAVSQKGARPLDLSSASLGKTVSSGKKHHRPPSSITKGLKNLMLDNAIAQPQSPSTRRIEPKASYGSLAEGWKSNGKTVRPSRADSTDSEWDMVNELPLRWATNYTPLASQGSRLHQTPVLLYEVWRNEAQRGPGGVLLAIATKSSILLYEAPKGERAFKFSKEFYTPLPARSITFIHQSVQDNMSRSPSDILPRSATLDMQSPRHNRVTSFTNAFPRTYSNQLSLFVVFEKKAGTIRLADSAVGEIDLFEDNWNAHQQLLASPSPSLSSLSSGSGGGGRRSRASWDGRGFTKEKGPWLRPAKFDIPGPVRGRTTLIQMYLLTRGRQSHLLPHPLPAKLSALPPYRVLFWTCAPTHVSVRVCTSDNPADTSFLQAVAFGEDGVEVQEVPLAELSERKGKGRAQDPLRTQADVGGAAGLLLVGGHWDRPLYPGLTRSYSTASYDSTNSIGQEGHLPGIRGPEGIYAWVQKGAEDYRIIWLGDARTEDEFEDAGTEDDFGE